MDEPGPDQRLARIASYLAADVAGTWPRQARGQGGPAVAMAETVPAQVNGERHELLDQGYWSHGGDHQGPDHDLPLDHSWSGRHLEMAAAAIAYVWVMLKAHWIALSGSLATLVVWLLP